MNDYGKLLKQKTKMLDVTVIQHDIESANNWKETYQIGEYVYKQASGERDKLIMDAYEKAFRLGLNIRTDRDCFLKATQNIARIYFQFRKYDEAINKLMVLDSNVDYLPDWVNLYYVSAQIHTETILYWAEVPIILFKRLDSIDEKNTESVNRRKYLFLEFLNRIIELSKTKDISKINKDEIFKKAKELGIDQSRECLNLKYVLGIIPSLPDLPEGQNLEPGSSKVNSSIYEQMVKELQKRVTELLVIVDRQAASIEHKESQLEKQNHHIEKLLYKIKSLEDRYESQSKELKSSKEQEYTIKVKYSALEKQLSGNEVLQKQLKKMLRKLVN